MREALLPASRGVSRIKGYLNRSPSAVLAITEQFSLQRKFATSSRFGIML